MKKTTAPAPALRNFDADVALDPAARAELTAPAHYVPRSKLHPERADLYAGQVECRDCGRWAHEGEAIRHAKHCDVAPGMTVAPRQPGEALPEIPDTPRIIVSGATYQHRDAIRHSGGVWKRVRKVWEVSREAALALRLLPGLRFEAAGESEAVNRAIVRAVNDGQGALVASDDAKMTSTTKPSPATTALEYFLVALECFAANGGSSKLSGETARPLLRRGWITKTGNSASGRHGWPARYQLTPEGSRKARTGLTAAPVARRRPASRSSRISRW